MEVRAKVEEAAKMCGILDSITISERKDGKVQVEREDFLTLTFLGQLDEQGLRGYIDSETRVVVWN